MTDGTPVPADTFRSMMAGFPTGVTVVTALDGTRPWGMTCTALCAVAVDPAILLVSLRTVGPTVHAVLDGKAFTVNFLHAHASQTARLFASGAPDRFDRVRWETTDGCGGPHLPENAHTIADCRVVRADEVGDHVVVYGEVISVRRLEGDTPLLYGLREYASWPAQK
jgi:flavin reductase (NADH)